MPPTSTALPGQGARVYRQEKNPHWFGMPAPPHEAGKVQVPQDSVPPHPSGMDPQFAPSAAQVVGTQHDGSS